MLHNMKGQFAEHLMRTGFVSSKDPKDPKSNVNSGTHEEKLYAAFQLLKSQRSYKMLTLFLFLILSDNEKLIKAVIVAGLYPKVAMIRPSNSKKRKGWVWRCKTINKEARKGHTTQYRQRFTQSHLLIFRHGKWPSHSNISSNLTDKSCVRALQQLPEAVRQPCKRHRLKLPQINAFEKKIVRRQLDTLTVQLSLLFVSLTAFSSVAQLTFWVISPLFVIVNSTDAEQIVSFHMSAPQLRTMLVIYRSMKHYFACLAAKSKCCPK